MVIHFAPHLLPISHPPIRNGWVAVEAGRIAAFGGPGEAPPAPANTVIRRNDDEVILPALVNAHAHLELSWMEGLVSPAASMPDWAAALVDLRRSREDVSTEPVVRAIAAMHESGTGLVGDVSNTLLSYGPLAEHHAISAHVFHELLGFSVRDAQERVAAAVGALNALPQARRLRVSIVPHAPYSVSPALFREIAAASAAQPISVHLAESADELEFLRSGTGRWRALLERLGAWAPEWTPPQCGPVEYLEQFGMVNDRLLAVHGVQLTDAELRRLAAAGATVVTCPRSNRWTGAGTPPVERFFASGVRVAVGTDSLAGVKDLNMFAELAALRAAAPSVPAARLLESATRRGAEALGFGDDLGTIAPGRRASLIAVRVPPDVADVEEYLLTGINPSAVRWVAGDEWPGT